MLGLTQTVPNSPPTTFNVGELVIAGLGVLGATVLTYTGQMDSQQTISIYTLVFGYVFGRVKQ